MPIRITKTHLAIRTKATSLARPRMITSATKAIAAKVLIIFVVDQTGFRNAPAESSDLTGVQPSRLPACKRGRLRSSQLPDH